MSGPSSVAPPDRSIRMHVGVKTNAPTSGGVLDQLGAVAQALARVFQVRSRSPSQEQQLEEAPHQPGGPTVATVPAAAGGGRGRGRTGAGVRVLSARPVTVRLVEVVVSLRLPEEKGPAPWPSQRNSHVRNLVLLDDQSTSPQRVNPILSGLV